MSSMLPRELILHIGFNKTASTWFQHHVFPYLEQVQYIGRGKDPVRGLRRDLVRACPAYQALGLPTEQWRHRADDVIRALVAPAKDGRPGVVSHERMSAPWRFFGERGKPIRHPDALPESLALLRERALALGVERVAVLFFIRRQDSYLPSFYAERSDRIPRAGQSDFEAQLERILGEEYATRGAFLDYGRTVRALQQALPEADLKVLPFERLRGDAEQVLREVGAFLGEDGEALVSRVDTGRRGRQRGGKRPNTWTLRPRRGAVIRPAKLRRRLGLDAERTEVTLTADWAERIRETYRASNRGLAAALPELVESLTAHGYIDEAPCG
ncbi:hypothetical protein [Halorhodospira sp. 9622]|uniref:hypothetical protein n=1 Tax=Halorhodospira sp. 9622 TaxID=2899136 RepID=UPI001EE96B2E|nr:hypothetical protein [Halorhodospira sp. 9622]MCG5539068.1 hypothetical protein [Halorhodospira sp. 9622]